MKVNPETYIYEFQKAVALASMNQEVWWVLWGGETRGKFLKAMNKYSHFFYASEQAHLIAMIVTLYRLYENRDDTFNIPYFLKIMGEESKYSKSALEKFNSRCAELKPTWIKINVLRNKFFGHRNLDYTAREIFDEAAITSNQIKDFIEKTKDLINAMSQEWDKSTHAFNLSAKEDTLDVLGKLAE